MATSEDDFDLLQSYLDGELPVAECEGLWQRLAAEPELDSELQRFRIDRALRQQMWDSLEPAEHDAHRMHDHIVHAARRARTMRIVSRVGSVLTSIAACLLFGFAVGWFGRGHVTSPMASRSADANMVSGVTPPGAQKYVVYVRDASGNVVATQQFDSYAEAQQFANDLTRSQEMQRSPLVPAEDKY